MIFDLDVKIKVVVVVSIKVDVLDEGVVILYSEINFN